MAALRTSLDRNGRLLIPKEIRKAYNMQEGDTYVIKTENNIIQIMSSDAVVDKLHELFFKHKPKTNESIVDEFLKEKQQEYELEKSREDRLFGSKGQNNE